MKALIPARNDTASRAQRRQRREARTSRAQRRQRREARKGWIMVAISAVMMATMLTGAYHADKARGMTPSASLASWGL